MPSISTSGETLEPVPIVPTPRILNCCVEFKAPPLIPVEIFIPGTTPCRASTTLFTGRAVSSSELTAETAPVRFSFFCVPKPTTTTSSRSSVSEVNKMSIVVLPSTETTCVLMPT